ncbi:hypothetical protein AgCh_008351 [Apium graveolens]
MKLCTMKNYIGVNVQKLFGLQSETNSKFFHAAATRRKKMNNIHLLIDEDGNRVDNQNVMGQMVVEYFNKKIPGNQQIETHEEMIVGGLISKEQNEMLISDIKFEEFSKVIKRMHPDKAAGSDGFSPVFFQHFWEMLGPEIFKCCSDSLRELSFPVNLDDTILVLIPKKDNVKKIADLGPIALCNVLYKILAKVLANKLKEILPGLIFENQSVFVPRRIIFDNVLVVFELLHFVKKKNRGSDGEVALKLDISKAFDRVSRNYQQKRMKIMGCTDKWTKWVMLCTTHVNYMINFNGRQVGPITLS